MRGRLAWEMAKAPCLLCWVLGFARHHPLSRLRVVHLPDVRIALKLAPVRSSSVATFLQLVGRNTRPVEVILAADVGVIARVLVLGHFSLGQVDNMIY